MMKSKTVPSVKDVLTRELIKGNFLTGKISRKIIGTEMKCDANSRRKIILDWITKNPEEAKIQKKIILEEERKERLLLSSLKNPEAYHVMSDNLKQLAYHFHDEKKKEKTMA